MSAADILKKFAHHFGVPFLLGQRCTIADPLGPSGADAIAHGLDVDVGLADALERQVTQAALLCELCPAPFDEDASTLMYAVHEVFAACHPQAASFYSRAHLYCEAAEERVLKLPRTTDPHRLLTRHLIVGRCFATHRTDVHLTWWTGSASFYGTEPPSRLAAWPGLRRVKEERRKNPMWRIALVDGDEETRVARTSLLTALLDISPLTRLLLLGMPVQKEIPFSLLLPFKHQGKRMSPMFLLEDRRIARAVTDQLLATGVENAGPMLALALLAAVREGAAPLAQQRAAELCTHLFLMMCLIEGDSSGAKEARALRALLDEDVTQMPDPLRVYWATVKATLSLDGETFLLPNPDELGPATARLWRRASERLAHPHLEIIGDPLMRELKRRLPSLAAAA
jgi:hypothetical protein